MARPSWPCFHGLEARATSGVTATVLRKPWLGGKGFTLIELVVAVALIALIVVFSGVIFKASIGSYRTASAQAEIMQKLRAITQQLDSDFRGLRNDAPVFMWFRQPSFTDANRFDQIMFFADGDFQSNKLWLNKPVAGNVARIYYGQSQNTYTLPEAPKRILARRQHILTADVDLNSWPNPNPANFVLSFTLNNNDFYEYDRMSLSQWQALASYSPAINNQIIDACIGRNGNSRPMVDLADANDLHMLMTEGVGSFSIQWAYISTAGTYYWWPSIDPDGNGSITDSDFTAMMNTFFGIYLNAPAGVNGLFGLFWHNPAYADNLSLIMNLTTPFFPSALKFTFTLYDSRGVFKDGQTFTHIVYIGQ